MMFTVSIIREGITHCVSSLCPSVCPYICLWTY